MTLPNFLYIGAARAGSTWLYSRCLRDHPDIYMSPVKEIKFFSNDENYRKGLAWYESHFIDYAGQTAVGEATPLYLSSSLAPERIQTVLGHVKLIVSLRHPVERAYSAYWNYLAEGGMTSDGDFLTLFQSGQRFRNAGYYCTHLSHYLDYFPRENLLVLIYEDDIAKNPQQGITKCYEFLGVDSSFVPDRLITRENRGGRVKKYHDAIWAWRRALAAYSLPDYLRKPLQVIGRGVFELIPKRQNGYEPLAVGMRQQLLNEYYQTDMVQLEQLLGRDLSIWYD